MLWWLRSLPLLFRRDRHLPRPPVTPASCLPSPHTVHRGSYGALHIALPPEYLPPIIDPYDAPPIPTFRLWVECIDAEPSLCKLYGVRCDDEVQQQFEGIMAQHSFDGGAQAGAAGAAFGHGNGNPLGGMDIDSLVRGVDFIGGGHLQPYQHSFSEMLMPSSPDICAELSDAETSASSASSMASSPLAMPEVATLHRRAHSEGPDLFGLDPMTFLSEEEMYRALDALVGAAERRREGTRRGQRGG